MTSPLTSLPTLAMRQSLNKAIAHATGVGQRLCGDSYRLTAETVTGTDPRITNTDCDTVNDHFWKTKYDTDRRVWEAMLGRLRRLADLTASQEESLFVIDFVTTPVDIGRLWKRFSAEPKRWRLRSAPWDFLCQFGYRRDLPHNLVNRLQLENGLCKGLDAPGTLSTGYRAIFTPPDQDSKERVLGELIAGMGRWFTPLYLLADEAILRLSTNMHPYVPAPFESPQLENPLEIGREKIVESIRKIAPQIEENPKLRIFTFETNSKGFSDGAFVDWPIDTSRKTDSATILVGSGAAIFLVDCQTLLAKYATETDHANARRMAAKHYRHQRAIHEIPDDKHASKA